MKQQISRLTQKQVLIVVFGLYYQLNGLFPHFLCNFIDSLRKQLSHIRLFIISSCSQPDYFFEIEQKILTMVAFAPAGIGARMAYRAQGFGLDKQGIVVAIT